MKSKKHTKVQTYEYVPIANGSIKLNLIEVIFIVWLIDKFNVTIKMRNNILIFADRFILSSKIPTPNTKKIEKIKTIVEILELKPKKLINDEGSVSKI